LNPFQTHRARCVRFAFSLSLLAAAATQAQTVVITGTREPLAPERLAADLAVIDAETIRNTTADSLADLLRREAGVQISRSGGPGQSTGLLLRGASSQQSVVLVDGVRIGSATLGSAAMETLGLAQVERIEVLRGPGSSLYGADAMGGVVNVITRSGGPGLQLDGRLAVGGYGSREAAGGLRGQSGAWDYAATLASERSDGVSALRPSANTAFYQPYNPDRDGYRLDTAQLRLGVKPAAGHRIGLLLLRTHLNSQYDAEEYAPPGYVPNATPDFRTRQDTTVAAFDWRGQYSARLSASARVATSEDDARNGGTLSDRFHTTRQQVAAQLAWQTGALGQIVGAVEHETLRARSSSYGEAGVERRNHAVAVELTGAAGIWSWQGDVRRDDSSDFGGVSTGRIGGGVTLASGWRLRALAGSTFRAPSFNDLYFPGYGVTTLRPERGNSIEIGLNWRAEGGEASATVYRNRVRELIGYESDRSHCPADPAYDYGCAANVKRARLQGATLAAAQRLGPWALRAQLDFLAANDLDTGARLPRRAAHQASLGADWTVADWTLGASVLNLGARPDGGQVLAAETTLDLSAVWRLAPAWQVQAKLLNATDRDLQPALGYNGLGRQGWLVLRYEPRT
jgi:vitamin B12 transporter